MLSSGQVAFYCRRAINAPFIKKAAVILHLFHVREVHSSSHRALFLIIYCRSVKFHTGNQTTRVVVTTFKSHRRTEEVKNRMHLSQRPTTSTFYCVLSPVRRPPYKGRFESRWTMDDYPDLLTMTNDDTFLIGSSGRPPRIQRCRKQLRRINLNNNPAKVSLRTNCLRRRIAVESPLQIHFCLL